MYVYTTIYNKELRPSTEELDGGRFWTREEISDALGKEILTPNFESEREWLKTHPQPLPVREGSR